MGRMTKDYINSIKDDLEKEIHKQDLFKKHNITLKFNRSKFSKTGKWSLLVNIYKDNVMNETYGIYVSPNIDTVASYNPDSTYSWITMIVNHNSGSIIFSHIIQQEYISEQIIHALISSMKYKIYHLNRMEKKG